MNERMKQLALQAGMQTTSLHYGRRDPYVLWEDDIEKFAELIVRECVDHLEVEYGQSALTGNAAAKSVKKHFGVEE